MPLRATGASQPTRTTGWRRDANPNLTDNLGGLGVGDSASLTYNQHHQTTSITDAHQRRVATTYAEGTYQSPTIGGGHVGDQNILSYAAYSPWASADAGTHSLHSAWGYSSTDNGKNNQTCADPSSPWYCAVINPIVGPGGFLSILPGLFHGQAESAGSGGATSALEGYPSPPCRIRSWPG